MIARFFDEAFTVLTGVVLSIAVVGVGLFGGLAVGFVLIVTAPVWVPVYLTHRWWSARKTKTENANTPHTVSAKKFEGDDDLGCIRDCRPLYLSHRYSNRR